MVPLSSGRLLHNAPSERNLEPVYESGVATWTQTLLKFVLSDERVSGVLPATSSPERARENAHAGMPPFFSEEEREYVSRMAQRR